MTNSREQAAREWREKIWAPNVSVEDFLKSGQGELLTIDDAFLAGCEHEAKRDKWVSVKERLPDMNKMVLIHDRDATCEGFAYQGKFTIQWVNESWAEDKVSPTHWQPLPEPPKEESD